MSLSKTVVLAGLVHAIKPNFSRGNATFSDLQWASTLRMADYIVRLDNRHRHTVRGPSRVRNRDCIAWRRWWKDTR